MLNKARPAAPDPGLIYTLQKSLEISTDATSTRVAPPRAPDTALLEQKLQAIHNHLYANGTRKTPHAIASEVVKVLRCGQYIENQRGDGKPAFAIRDSDYARLRKGDDRVLASFASEIRQHCLRTLADTAQEPPELNLTDYDILYTCFCLSNLRLTDTDRDVVGDAMEAFRSIWAKTYGGQFFTDQRVTRLAMSLLQFDPMSGDDLVDICAGTGGFILAAIDHVARAMEGDPGAQSEELGLAEVVASRLFGQEIDSEVCAVANSSIAMRLSCDLQSVVQLGNSLLPSSFQDPESAIRFDTHSCAATNPPFGAKITVKDPAILRHYELSRPLGLADAGASGLVSRSLDMLFVEQNLNLLKPGSGRLAIVLPHQIASGPQTQFIREWLLRRASLVAVVDLPSETFQPYTGTKTCLLVVKRRARATKAVELREDGPNLHGHAKVDWPRPSRQSRLPPRGDRGIGSHLGGLV